MVKISYVTSYDSHNIDGARLELTFVEHSVPEAILGIENTAVDTVSALMQISF